jgi:hypothetical protein
MPRSGLGVASPPANTRGGPANTPISSSKYNQVLDDVYALFNTVFPVAYGGTGGSSKEAARTELELDKKVVYAAKSANYTALLADNNAVFRFTATATLSLDAAATLGSNWHAVVIADGGDVTIDPNSSETIDGQTTLLIRNGNAVEIICSGTAFFTDKAQNAFANFIQSKSADYTVAVSDRGSVISVDASGAARTITLIAAATAGNGFTITVKKSDSSVNAVTIDGNASETIDGSLTRALSVQNQSVSLICDGSNWKVIAEATTGITVGTLTSATGSAVDFTGIPSGVKRITIAVLDVSTAGAFTPVLQLGDSGGIETTGYVASNTLVVNAAATSVTTFTNPGFPFGGQSAANSYNGKIVLDLVNPATNLWACSGIVGAATLTSFPSGYKATSAVLDRVRFIVGGSDTYDAGNFNISWEF